MKRYKQIIEKGGENKERSSREVVWVGILEDLKFKMLVNHGSKIEQFAFSIP